jgi:tetratricopeptide (TPR) repeat protein
LPHSPHDFVYKENSCCVNEGFLRADLQRFPNHTDKIQLNHYYCRSEHEIEMKLLRGNSGAINWPRKRFDMVNAMAVYTDTGILQNLQALFERVGRVAPQAGDLVENMAALARAQQPGPLAIMDYPREARSFRAEFSGFEEIKSHMRLVGERGDLRQVNQLLLQMIQLYPQFINPYIDLSINYLVLGDAQSAWQALTRAWQTAPNTYAVLVGMAFYFFKIQNFAMAEKTCQLILEIAPHNLMILGFLTDALIGEGRYDEAIEIGLPVVELSAQLGELPKGMGILLVKKMADYLLKKKDYARVVRLWQAGVLCQPGDVDALLELSRVLLLVGDRTDAHHSLVQAQSLAPQNEKVLALLKQLEADTSLPARKARIRKHR